MSRARLRRGFYAHEAARQETGETRLRLEILHEHRDRRGEELERLPDLEGLEAVTPALRYG